MNEDIQQDKELILMGLDEAGRGCIIGDLVVGAFWIPASQLQALKDTGATDSKKLSAKKRKRILDMLPGIGNQQRVHITPQQIDSGNLNQLEEAAFVELIASVQPDVVYIDAPTHPSGIPAVERRLQQALIQRSVYTEDSLPKFIIEPKADLNYAVVSAASIVAKVHRDQGLEQTPAQGSGYPSDPKTRNWLKEIIRSKQSFPPCVRQRWGTIDNLKREVAQEQLSIQWDHSDENKS